MDVSALIRGNFKPKNAETGIQPHKYQMSIKAILYRLLMHTTMYYYFFTMSQSLSLLNLNLLLVKIFLLFSRFYMCTGVLCV